MKWIGLTGGIASGKTTVANLLKEQAVPIIDADQIAHQALKVHHDKIVSYFGSDILDERNRIDRSKLGKKVFSNEKQRKLLEGIVHPFVQAKVDEKKRLLASVGTKWAVYDVPLLYSFCLCAKRCLSGKTDGKKWPHQSSSRTKNSGHDGY